jgi:hypothetical protein
MPAQEFTRLPPVEAITGVAYQPTDSTVRIFYVSGAKTYELTWPVDKAFELEEWFIKIRRQIGQAHPRRFPSMPT